MGMEIRGAHASSTVWAFGISTCGPGCRGIWYRFVIFSVRRHPFGGFPFDPRSFHE
jgi:hypothetical protein